MIEGRKRAIGPADFAAGERQTLEGLRPRDFMNQVEVDIEQRRFTGRFVDDVGIPDFFKECLGGHGWELFLRTKALFNQNYRRAGTVVKTPNARAKYRRGRCYLILRVGAARPARASPRVTASSPKRCATASSARLSRTLLAAAPADESKSPSCDAFARSRLCTWIPARRTFSRSVTRATSAIASFAIVAVSSVGSSIDALRVGVGS